ncbi:MAG: hypothetical protein ACRENE_32130, partial [Polyangiaceae bacterium]
MAMSRWCPLTLTLMVVAACGSSGSGSTPDAAGDSGEPLETGAASSSGNGSSGGSGSTSSSGGGSSGASSGGSSGASSSG